MKKSRTPSTTDITDAPAPEQARPELSLYQSQTGDTRYYAEWHESHIKEFAYPAKLDSEVVRIFAAQMGELAARQYTALRTATDASYFAWDSGFNYVTDAKRTGKLTIPVTDLPKKHQTKIKKIQVLREELKKLTEDYQKHIKALEATITIPDGTIHWINEKAAIFELTPEASKAAAASQDRTKKAIIVSFRPELLKIQEAIQIAAQDALDKAVRRMSKKLQAVLFKHRMPIGPERQLTSGSEP